MAKKELQELIRIAANHILSNSERYDYITQPDLKQKLYGKFPHCFINIRRIGNDKPDFILPICNRGGIVDPVVIKISHVAVGKLLSDPSGLYDINDLQTILDKLDRLKARYDKENVKPPQASARKALVTRMFGNIKNHLDSIRNQNSEN